MSRYDDMLNNPNPNPNPNPPGVQPQQPHPQNAGPIYGANFPPPAPPRRPVRRRRRVQPLLLGCGLAFISMVSIITCVSLVIFAVVWNDLDTRFTEQLDKRQREAEKETFQTTHIYDRLGNDLHELFGEGRRTKVKLADMPKSLIDATIAVEDSTFYENPGVDW